MDLLKDRRIIITGGTSGIGEEIARVCVANGARVAVVSRGEEALESLAEDTGCMAIQADVSSEVDATRSVQEAADAFGGLDVVINNAGVSPYGEFSASVPSVWRLAFDVNVMGVLYVTYAALPYLRLSATADVVMLGSATTHKPATAMNGLYVATKAAVTSFSEALRAEVRPLGIRVTTVSPGAVATRIANTIPDPALRAAMTHHLAEHGLCPEDVARQVLYLLREPRHVDLREILVTPLAIE